jgi:predicted nucleic acid-binding protein
MIVVADTSPLNYLIQIESDDLLPKLYERVVIPLGVMQELEHASAPVAVRAWLKHLPGWIDVASTMAPPNDELAFLGLGEREAIQLAEERHADLLLMDERKGRLEANRRGLATTGTLGVLLSAGVMRLIDPEQTYRRLLTETTFRTSAELESRFLVEIDTQREQG